MSHVYNLLIRFFLNFQTLRYGEIEFRNSRLGSSPSWQLRRSKNALHILLSEGDVRQ